MFLSYKKVEVLAIFWYLIDSYYIQKCLVISIVGVLIIGKSRMSDIKSWAKRRIFAVNGVWFCVLSSSTR